MALTEELKKVYASNTYAIKAYDTVEVSHPKFSRTYFLVIADVPKQWKTESGTMQTFRPSPFSIKKPTKGDNQQDMVFALDNTAQIGIQELERAAQDMNIPIKIVYRVYIDGSQDPQSAPIELYLSNVEATITSISGVASRLNLFSRKVPARIYEPWVFKGLSK